MSGAEADLAALRRELARLSDVEAIRRLKHRYCDCNDGGWPSQGPTHMGPTADLFVEDGVWDGRPVAPLAEGRKAIREMMIRYRAAAPFNVHCVTNPEIDVCGDTATGRWTAAVFLTNADGASFVSVGKYDDVYVRTPEGWRFKSLTFTCARNFPVEAPLTADFVRSMPGM